ncbi:hypothetical protein [Paenibacillus illinoisensis]|uniref:Uncharacterized protein n=1 Tax=Paenibacillus illinoisensis TaxID=59845 RepID=A0A2W0CE55_9BACL|nr:hypothetical protein [Paenibacillus illinoisensis]PYY31016.1 Uncharacterized protein PIL02S_00563 [Paenibacillus illinoisensis]
MKNELEMLVMFEEDRAEQNVTAYIPYLKLGAHGDTIEEARINAMDLVEIEIENGCLKDVGIQDDARIEILHINSVQLAVMFENEMESVEVTAYIPALRLGVRGNTTEEARALAIELVRIELTKQKAELTEGKVVFDKLRVLTPQ